MDKGQFKKIQQFVAQTWKDVDTLSQFIQDPVQALQKVGISAAVVTVVLIPQGIPKVMAHSNGKI